MDRNDLNRIIDQFQDNHKVMIGDYLESVQKELAINNKFEQTTTELNEDDGFIESRGGELFIRDPKNNGKQPVLIPHSSVKIFVNNREIVKETVVQERDKVAWRPKDNSEFHITISKDKLKVFLQLHQSIIISYRIKDKKRALKFMFELEQIEKKIDIERVSSDIMDEIYKMGIKCDINITAILNELKSPTFQAVIVAEGIPIIESRDGYIKTNFQNNIEVLFEEIKGKVDFKNRIKIPTVTAGDIIAQVHKPLEGRDGFNVLGKILKSRPPKKVEVRTKNKVEIKDDGRVIALQPGRPTLTGNSVKYFDILQVHEVLGDVDIKTGNIMFNGDVIVYGHVKDNMRIDAMGNVYVKGNVYHSTIVSAQNIFIDGSVLYSNIFAGQHGVLLNQLYKIMQDLLFTFTSFSKVLDQIMVRINQENLANITLGKIINTLIEQKFSELIPMIKKLSDLVKEARNINIAIPASIQILYNMLKNFENTNQIHQIKNINIIENIIFSLNDNINQSEASILDNSEIHFKEADGAEIKANGCIKIHGRGTVNTKIFSGDKVIFANKDSVIRGGKIDAVNTIKANEVGALTGAIPYLSAGKQIEIKKLNHAKIAIQNISKDIFDPQENIVYTLEHETNSIISYSTSS
ncbi:FapA family protein [Calidifontibacillus oryziterrae]|uniref:FapA family protein n=1 Tax=Calidifontibacillus oryziterrae TaxID=1191699 RepID=UPI000312F885|nr:FapA family protein [Calidifontibacillus oryziterrae]